MKTKRKNVRSHALLPICLTLVSALAHAQKPEPVLPAITVVGKPEFSAVDSLPAAVGRVTRIDLDADTDQKRGLDAVLVDSGVAAWDAANSLGIANGLSVRGFVVANQGVSSLQVGRNFLNGHADLVWRFSRDPATVQSIDLVSGSDATLLGAGSPAASILYTTKSPEGIEAKKIGLTLGTSGLKRLVGDAEVHWGPVQTRAVVVLQKDDKGIQGQVSVALCPLPACSTARRLCARL